MKKTHLLIAIAVFQMLRCANSVAQVAPSRESHYWRSASEFIFSLGDVSYSGDSGLVSDINPALRFTGFLNFQSQYHIDFSRKTGFMTGFGVRNVGFINDIGDSIKLKQRVYSFGIPAAFKVGKLPDEFYALLGVEAELFFNYKQKAFYQDEKFKRSEWFSHKVNLFNPSIFVDFHIKQETYIRFKYYMNDMLRGNNQNIRINGTALDYAPQKSQLFYISIGTVVKPTDSKKKPNDTHNVMSRQF